MSNLVELRGNEVFTNSLAIAEGTGIEHRRIRATIRKYQKQLGKFGKLSAPYKAESTGGRPEEIYRLNEEQATFLITLLKNTEVVVAFKVELVRQFYAMRTLLLERESQAWQETRYQGKLTRKAETDVIKQLTEYAKAQGSKNSDKLYVVYSRLANKVAGVKSRDTASIMQLNNLNTIENIILHCIQLGILEGNHYKEIYQDSKKRLESYQEIAFLKTEQKQLAN